MLDVVYQDPYLVAIDKPPGLLVHRTGLDAGETRFAMQLLRDQLGRYVWPVHRLDKGTSGLLLFALDADTARLMGQAFESGNGLHKTYQAVVRGWPADDGFIDHPLRRMPDDARDAAGQRELVQSAQTRFRTLARLTLPLPQGAFEHTRLALLANEVQLEEQRLLRMLWSGLLALMFLGLGLVLFLVLVLSVWWEQRLVLLSVLGAGCGILAGFFYLRLRRSLTLAEPVFSSSLAQLQEDIEQLKAVSSHDSQAD